MAQAVGCRAGRQDHLSAHGYMPRYVWAVAGHRLQGLTTRLICEDARHVLLSLARKLVTFPRVWLPNPGRQTRIRGSFQSSDRRRADLLCAA